MLNKFKRWMKDNNGFTLSELLVVAAIIAILAAILLLRLLCYTDRARQAKAEADLKTMTTVVTAYAADEGKGQYPISSNDSAMSNSIAAVLQSHGIKWTGDAKGITDPWGHPYMYKQTAVNSSSNNRYIITIDYLKQKGNYVSTPSGEIYYLIFDIPLSVGNVNVISNYKAIEGDPTASNPVFTDNIELTGNNSDLMFAIGYIESNDSVPALEIINYKIADQKYIFLNPKPDIYLSFDKNILDYLKSY